MIPAPFDYHRPGSVREAVELLGSLGFDAKVLAGGQSLIPMMRFRLAEPAALVDLAGIGDLARLEEDGDHLRLGAMLTHKAIEESDLVRERYPLLAETAAVIADPLVRNRGTVGGSLVHADPAGDWGAVMLACRAELIAVGPDGERTIPIDDFFLTTFTSTLEPEEILTEIRLPRAGSREGGAYEKLERKVGDFATVAVAARVALAEDGTCRSAGLGLTGVGATNLRPAAAEEALVGAEPGDARIGAAAAKAAEECSPTADNRGSEAYKRDMVRVLSTRALARAVGRARGGRSSGEEG